MVKTPKNGEFVVQDRYQAMHLVRQHGGTWEERPVQPKTAA